MYFLLPLDSALLFVDSIGCISLTVQIKAHVPMNLFSHNGRYCHTPPPNYWCFFLDHPIYICQGQDCFTSKSYCIKHRIFISASMRAGHWTNHVHYVYLLSSKSLSIKFNLLFSQFFSVFQDNIFQNNSSPKYLFLSLTYPDSQPTGISYISLS